MTLDKAGENLPPVLMDQVFDDSYQPIQDLVSGYKRYCILLSALKSGLFDLLSGGPMTRERVLAETGCESPYGDSWLTVLEEIGLVESLGEKIRIPLSLLPYLVSKSPLYQGDSILSEQGAGSRWPDFSSFLQEKAERPVKPKGGLTPDFLRVVSEHSLRGEIQEVTRALCSCEEFRSGKRLLDIGGGHGMYSISFCQQNPHLTGVILDRSHITPFTREMIDRYNMTDRIQVMDGDMQVSLPGSGYDLVFISHVLYRNDDLPLLLQRIFYVLNPGGILVSNHKFREDWGCSDKSSLASLENDIIRDFHLMRPETEFLKILESTGFSRIMTKKVVSITGNSTLHCMKKPILAK